MTVTNQMIQDHGSGGSIFLPLEMAWMFIQPPQGCDNPSLTAQEKQR